MSFDCYHQSKGNSFTPLLLYYLSVVDNSCLRYFLCDKEIFKILLGFHTVRQALLGTGKQRL